MHTDLPWRAHGREVVAGRGQHEELIDFLETAHHHLSDAADLLGPSEGLLNEFALLLRDRITRTPGHGIGHRRATP